MTDAELIDRDCLMNLPTSFRVIGIGEATKEIIEAVNLCGYDCVSATVLNPPFECVPTEEDKLVIIVAKDGAPQANNIAKAFHDAGVLTLGLLDNADLDCYDSVVTDASAAEYPDLVKAILQPIVDSGIISYDYYDLYTCLSDTKHFLIKSAVGFGNGRVASALGSIKSALTSSLLNKIERISILLYFSKEKKQPLAMQEMKALTDVLKELPASIDAMWAVYPDENIKDDEIKVTIIAAGKELDNR